MDIFIYYTKGAVLRIKIGSINLTQFSFECTAPAKMKMSKTEFIPVLCVYVLAGFLLKLRY